MLQAIQPPPARGAHSGCGCPGEDTGGIDLEQGWTLPPSCSPLCSCRPELNRIVTGCPHLPDLVVMILCVLCLTHRAGFTCSGDPGLGVLPFQAPPHPSTLFLDLGPCPPGTHMSVCLDLESPGQPLGGVLEGFSGGAGRAWGGLTGGHPVPSRVRGCEGRSGVPRAGGPHLCGLARAWHVCTGPGLPTLQASLPVAP